MRTGLPVLNQYKAERDMCHGHKTVTPVRLEPAILLSRVKHSTTEPLCSTSDLYRSLVQRFVRLFYLEGKVVWVLLFMCGFFMFVFVVVCLLFNLSY